MGFSVQRAKAQSGDELIYAIAPPLQTLPQEADLPISVVVKAESKERR
jgi:hypothetical protein